MASGASGASGFLGRSPGVIEILETRDPGKLRGAEFQSPDLVIGGFTQEVWEVRYRHTPEIPRYGDQGIRVIHIRLGLHDQTRHFADVLSA